MKVKRKYLVFAIPVLVLFFALRSLELVPSHYREGCLPALSTSQKEQIRTDVKDLSIDEIIDYSLRLTAAELTFSRKVNCINYARCSSAICNYAFSVNSIEAKAKPVVGTVKLWGLDLCRLLYSLTGDTFVINHDFTEIQLQNTTVYVDACFKDVIFNDCKKIIR